MGCSGGPSRLQSARRVAAALSLGRSAASPRPRQVQLKMTRAHGIRAGIIALTVLVVVTACVLPMTHRSQARSLSLVFERYSTRMDSFDQDMVFLWITNSSD